MKELVEQIMLRLGAEVPEIRWIAVNRGQMESEGASMSYPCVLVDVSNVEWSTMTGDGSQRGKATIEVELHPDNGTSAVATTEEVIHNQGLEAYELAELVNGALHGWTPGAGGRLTRITTNRKRDRYAHPVVLTYSCNIG